jgi:hypothetical protein
VSGLGRNTSCSWLTVSTVRARWGLHRTHVRAHLRKGVGQTAPHLGCRHSMVTINRSRSDKGKRSVSLDADEAPGCQMSCWLTLSRVEKRTQSGYLWRGWVVSPGTWADISVQLPSLLPMVSSLAGPIIRTCGVGLARVLAREGGLSSSSTSCLVPPVRIWFTSACCFGQDRIGAYNTRTARNDTPRLTSGS